MPNEQNDERNASQQVMPNEQDAGNKKEKEKINKQAGKNHVAIALTILLTPMNSLSTAMPSCSIDFNPSQHKKTGSSKVGIWSKNEIHLLHPK